MTSKTNEGSVTVTKRVKNVTSSAYKNMGSQFMLTGLQQVPENICGKQMISDVVSRDQLRIAAEKRHVKPQKFIECIDLTL